MNERILTWGCVDGATLADLRHIVKECEGMDEDSLVFVRTKFSVNRHGSAVKSIVVAEVRA